MTTGSKTDDRRSSTACYELQGTNYTTLAPALVGSLETKTWSGSDYPLAKPVYTKHVYVFRDGTKVTCKRRSDVPTRRKTEDHNYTATIAWERFNVYAFATTYTFQPSLNYTGVHGTKIDYGYQYGTAASDEWNSNDTIAALGKLREKVAGSDFNAGVFLAEGSKALTMITDSAVRIRKGLTAIKRGDVIGAAKALGSKKPTKVHKTASANWLELQYGWMPLVKDAYGGAEFLGKLLNFPMVQTYKVRRKKKMNGTWSFPGWTSKKADASTTYQILARLTEVNPYQLSGLTDPASIVWELTPYSFVADWFIPIGNYLAARSLASALTGTFVTTKVRRVSAAYTGHPGAGNAFVSTSHITHPSCNWTQINVDRTVSTTLSVPVPRFKPLSDVPSWKHCANAVALLVQKKF